MAEEAVNGGAQNGNSKVLTFSAVKPQLFVEAGKANDAVQFYMSAFGAEEVSRVSHPKRKAEQEVPLVLYAEIKLGSSTILVSDLIVDSSPVKTVGTGLVFTLETDDVEAAVAKAVTAGAVAESEISEGEGACAGDRVGKVTDPYGIVWLISSTIKKAADVECLEMVKLTPDEREVFTKLINDLSKEYLGIGKGYYDRSFWCELLNLYHERMNRLNRPFTRRTWADMISMGQDLQYKYTIQRDAGGRIDQQLEEIFGLCESCKRRIPIFSTSLQKGQASTYISAFQAKKSGLQHGNFGGGNVHGNSGNSGSLNLRSHHERGFVFYGGETSSSVLRPTLPDDVLKIMIMLVEEHFLRFDQYMELFKASKKWAEEGNFLIYGMLRDPDILPAKKVKYLLSAAGFP